MRRRNKRRPNPSRKLFRADRHTHTWPKRNVSGFEKQRATPLARRLARQRGIDLRGSRHGRRGRIEKQDVLGLEQVRTSRFG